MNTETPLTHDEQRMYRLRFALRDTQAGNKYRKPNEGGGLVRVSVADLKWLLEKYEELLDLVIEQADAEVAETHSDA